MFIFNENSFYGFRAFTCKTKIENGLRHEANVNSWILYLFILFNVIYFNFILNSFFFI